MEVQIRSDICFEDIVCKCSSFVFGIGKGEEGLRNIQDYFLHFDIESANL